MYKYLIEKLTMFFSRSEISEKELIDSIQKELGVPQKTAKQIAEEIKNTLIPTLWNNLSQKDRGSLLYTKKQEEKPKEIKKTTSEKLPMSSDIENNLRLESELPKKSVPPLSALTINKKSDGPDRYRESIE